MAKEFDYYIEGLNELLRDFSKLGKEASKELRLASKTIAERHMVPAWKDAAMSVKSWNEDLADSIRAGSDRLPKVMIGNQKKTTEGGATPNMLRYPTSTGEGGLSFAPFERTNWLAKPRSKYMQATLNEWSDAVDRVAKKWGAM